MATLKGKNEGKSMFLKEYLVDHPDAGTEVIDEAWREAGNEGTISASLIGKVRKDLGRRASGRRLTRSLTPAGPDPRSEAELRRRRAAGGGR